MDTMCTRCQILFTRENKKKISICRLLNKPREWQKFREMETLSGEITQSKLFLSLSENASSLKGKNLHPSGANSFLLEKKPSFSEGTDVQKRKLEITKIVSLV